MVAPGLAAIQTVLDLHSAARIGDPRATWGITQGNPVHDAVRAIANQVGVTFNLDVTLNREHAITNVFAGELFASHALSQASLKRKVAGDSLRFKQAYTRLLHERLITCERGRISIAHQAGGALE